MAPNARPITTDAGEHAVQFYAHDDELARSVGGFLVGALRAGGVAIVIATPAHRHAFERALEAAGIDPETAVAEGRLLSLDAASTLARFSDGDSLDPAAFRELIGRLIDDCTRRGPVYAYGEMVSLLWEAGDVLAAIELEKLWNELGRDLHFSLLCGYHSVTLSDPAHADSVRHVCDLHTTVLGAEHRLELQPGPDAPAAARRFVTALLREYGHGEEAVENARVVISELATNAVIHANSSLTVRLRDGGDSVRLSVGDDSEAAPVRRHGDPDALSGRGLWIVGALAARWGVEYAGRGKTVWAELPAA